MTTRNWVLVGVFATLGLIYALFFTEWFRPAPIEIASQVRFAIQPPRFGRPAKQTNQPGSKTEVEKRLAEAATSAPGQPEKGSKPAKGTPIERVVLRGQFERVGRPEGGAIDQAPGGVANVTFCLDNWYRLTRIRVEDVPADGSVPNVLWQLTGKSVPVNSLLFGQEPTGMKPLLEGSHPEPLKPGVPYRLIVESGRHRGTNDFRTIELRPQE